MSITPAVVQHVAKLARLEVSPDETLQYTEQLSRILELMAHLDALPTENIPPMTHAVNLTMPERQDMAVPTNQREAMLANAPDQAEGCFRTPKFVE